MRWTTSSIGRPPPNLDRPLPEAADGQWDPSPTLAVHYLRQRTANADVRRASVSAIRSRPAMAVHHGPRRPPVVAVSHETAAASHLQPRRQTQPYSTSLKRIIFYFRSGEAKVYGNLLTGDSGSSSSHGLGSIAMVALP
jgi:hypothetical protein